MKRRFGRSIVFLFCLGFDWDGLAAGEETAGENAAWKRYHHPKLQFSVSHPPQMILKAEIRQAPDRRKYEVLEWKLPNETWHVSFFVHEASSGQSVSDWVQHLGGTIENTTLADGAPAVLRTSLFEAVYEKSVFFQSAGKIVEIRLVVPGIVDWMGSRDKVEPQFRHQERIFKKLVRSIRIRSSVPQFEEFTAAEIFKGKPVPPDLSSHPKGRYFRTRLRQGVRSGPNFAGHFTVITWGCGTACTQLAIVDAKTGKIYFAPFAIVGASFRPNSRLLVVDPPEFIREFHGGPCPRDAWLTESRYYEWTGADLVEIAKVNACN